MDKKRLLVIVGAAVVAVIVLLVGLSFLGGGKDEQPNTGEVKLNTDVTLSEADKASIKDSTQKFVVSLGNYGWYPDLIKNPQVAAGDKTNQKLFEQEHTTVDDSKAALRALTNSSSFDGSVNELAYSTPFSVETRLLEDIAVPDKPVAEGSKTFVPVSVPIESTLSYIGSSIGYYDENNNWNEPKEFVQQFTFQGKLDLQFSQNSGKWVVVGFDNTVGVFATDKLSFSNGDAISEYLATSSNQLPVNR